MGFSVGAQIARPPWGFARLTARGTAPRPQARVHFWLLVAARWPSRISERRVRPKAPYASISYMLAGNRRGFALAVSGCRGKWSAAHLNLPETFERSIGAQNQCKANEYAVACGSSAGGVDELITREVFVCATSYPLHGCSLRLSGR